MLHPRKLLLAGLFSAIPIQPGIAVEEDWSLCRVQRFQFLVNEEIAIDETRVEARLITSENSETIHLVGDARILRRDQQVEADDIVITRSTEEINAFGNVVFADPVQRIKSTEVYIDNLNNQARFDLPEFEIQARHAHGEAERMEKLDEFRSRYTDLAYTSCDPDDGGWLMRASELEIDQESGLGSAWHPTLYMNNVPFMYLPYIQFPIDDRRMSGILSPSVGKDSRNGATVVVPVYWNQAPNYDMTITPIWYNDSGLQLNTENRYLLGAHYGEVNLSHIDDSQLDELRWFRQWSDDSTIPFDLQAGVLIARVSDGDFFDDYKLVAPQYKNTRHLESHVSLNREGAAWQGELLWQEFQTLDDTTAVNDRPYSSLPSFTLNAQPEAWQGEVQLPLHFQWANFEREESVNGTRTNFVPRASWRSENSWYFLEPELQLAFTSYKLEDNPGGDSLYRALPTLGIDSGLIFERDAGDNAKWRQTLEPRLYFLYTPYQDQDDFPDFDTSLASLNYNNLFRNNRFFGADRIGDAKQVTVGLASRLFDADNGNELVHARAGQIFYFEDRRVSLNGVTADLPRSDLIAELDLWPYSTLTISTRLVYDPTEKNIYDRDFSVNYSNKGVAANFGYYFTENNLEQALVSAAYPISERWEIFAQVHRSLLFDKPVENLLGISYQSCCWGLKILAGQTGNETDDFAITDTSIYFEMTFKGLSQAGEDIDSRLSAAIPGYRSAF